MRHSLFAFALPFFAVQLAVAQLPEATQHLVDLSASTALNRTDVGPVHLRMSYQLYDLDGKATSSGTAEEWWGSATSQHTVISPSATGANAANVQSRDAFLVKALLSQVVQPLPAYNSTDKVYAAEAKRKFGNQEFSCIAVSRQAIKPWEVSSYKGAEYCFDTTTNVLRVVFVSSSFAVAHNSLMKFHGITFSAADAISSAGRLAITGHVELLDGDRYSGSANSSPDPFFFLADAAAMSNRRNNFVQPDYPDEAKQQHISGTVMLAAVISKQGNVKSLDVLLNPATSLTQAAMNAVKQWTYKPYLVDGNPVEIETAITVNYNIGHE